MDANVFIDRHTDDAGERGSITRDLLDGLDGRVELLPTPELGTELNRRADDDERARLHQLHSLYLWMPVAATILDAIVKDIVRHAGIEPRSDRDRSDLRHIAYAAGSGVRALITWDEASRKRWGPAALALFDVAVVSPLELPVLLDELESAPGYTPAALLGTGYTAREATTADQDSIRSFLDTAGSELAPTFVALDRTLASRRPTGGHRVLFSNPEGETIALVGYTVEGESIEVSLIRMRRFALGSTLAPQMVARLRQIASQEGVSVIRVSDDHPNAQAAEAMLADGFELVDGTYIAISINAVTSSDAVASVVQSAMTGFSRGETLSFAPLLELCTRLTSDAGPDLFATVERRLRPLRVADAPLPTWLISIKPPWSAQLFNHPPDLLGQTPELGMSLEHVYYRGGRSGEEAPARIVWWVSGPSHGYAIGCSELVEVHDGSPSDLYRGFRRLGVWNWDQVQAASNKGSVRALRFINTEMFRNEVSLLPFERLYSKDLRQPFPQRINAALFEQILRKGRHEHPAF